MTTRKLSVRLVAENGRQVRAELEGVGDTGEKAFQRIEARSKAASAAIAAATVAAAAAIVAMGTAMVRSGLQVIQSQADVAQSLDTTVESLQALHHAADLTGVATGEAEGGVRRLTRRLSLFAKDGGGPAAKAIEQLRLDAEELLGLPIDQRLMRVNEALDQYAGEAERAALLSQLFGDNSWMAFSRLDTDILRRASRDVHDFGVVVSDVDAAAISRTNEALSRMGLIWRGLANQLTVAVAPGIEAVASAMAALAARTGPLGRAIELIFGNLDRLATYAGAFVVFMAGRWVTGMRIAGASVLSLSGTLTVLRGAIIRTGIGALIVGAGELVYWFGQLARGAGGLGSAFELLGDLAGAVWEGIKTTVSSLADDFRAIKADISGIWSSLMSYLADKWADFLRMIGPTFNAVADQLGLDVEIDILGAANYASFLENAAHNAGIMADRFRSRAAGTRAGAFDGVGDAVQALTNAVSGALEDGEDALAGAADAAGQVADALDQAGAAGGRAGQAISEGAEVSLTALESVQAALESYAEKARDIGGDIGNALVSAFQNAENAIGEFVKTGKLQFSDLVTSLLADLAKLGARRFLLGPLASALSGALGGAGGIFAGILHSGGMAGAPAPARMVPAAAFLDAPRFHGGGWPGLRSDEVPAILQRGERVLSRREVAEGAGGVTINIHARDAESFRQSRAQIAADIARAVAFGRRGM